MAHQTIERNKLIELFDTKAAIWTRKYDRQLHYRIELFIEMLQRYCPQRGKVLDLGCGTGVLMLHASKNGYVVYGLDISEYMLKECSILLEKNAVQAELYYGNLEIHAAHLPKFDAIICSSVLEYVPAPREFLAQCQALLMPKGVLLLTVPHKDAYLRKGETVLRRLLFMLSPLRAFPKIQAYLEYLTLSVNRYTLQEVQFLAEECGFSLREAYYVHPKKGKSVQFDRKSPMLFGVLQK